MNLLGRLLIVLIFIGSIMFATLSLMMYATHTNWRKETIALKEKLEKKEAEFRQLQNDKDAMETALNLQLNSLRTSIAASEQKAQNLTLSLQQSQTELASTKAELEEVKTSFDLSVKETNSLRARLDAASKALFKAQTEWLEMSDQYIKKNDEAYGLAIQLTSFQAKAALLAQDYRDAMEVLRIHGLKPDPTLYASQPPSGIQGVVTAVVGNDVEISIGSDSGLSKGHQLDVVRIFEGRESYIGKIEITSTAADRAAAKVIPAFRRGYIRQGDEVMYIEVNEFSVR